MTVPNDPDRAGQLVPAAPAPRVLTAAEFHQLANVPPAMTWFANIYNEQTRRAYQNDVREFMASPASRIRTRSAWSAVATCWPGAATWSAAR